MQGAGVLSFIACIFCMYGIYLDNTLIAEVSFALSLLFFTVSLVISFIEIQLSNKALELELSDMDERSGPSVVQYLKKKLDDREKPVDKRED